MLRIPAIVAIGGVIPFHQPILAIVLIPILVVGVIVTLKPYIDKGKQ